MRLGRGASVVAVLWLGACAEAGSLGAEGDAADPADAYLAPADAAVVDAGARDAAPDAPWPDAAAPDAPPPDAAGPDAHPCAKNPWYEPVEHTCDGFDNDCDGTTDNVANPPAWYQDADGDTYGNGAVTASGCSQPPGYVGAAGDCNDQSAQARPGLAEVCDGLDNDCDGGWDNVANPPVWYQDADGDGHGNPAVAVAQCAPPGGFVAASDDCDDGDWWRRPGLGELCDGLDNDCNGGTGEACPGQCEVQVRPDDGRRYLFCNGDTSWVSAQQTCASQGFRLVRVSGGNENGWVRQTADGALGGGTKFWIGANDRGAEGAWRWDDGAQFWQGKSGGSVVGGLYTHWNSGEPNDDGGEDCGEVQSDGEWNDIPCDLTREYVCERY